MMPTKVARGGEDNRQPVHKKASRGGGGGSGSGCGVGGGPGPAAPSARRSGGGGGGAHARLAGLKPYACLVLHLLNRRITNSSDWWSFLKSTEGQPNTVVRSRSCFAITLFVVHLQQ